MLSSGRTPFCASEWPWVIYKQLLITHSFLKCSESLTFFTSWAEFQPGVCVRDSYLATEMNNPQISVVHQHKIFVNRMYLILLGSFTPGGVSGTQPGSFFLMALLTVQVGHLLWDLLGNRPRSDTHHFLLYPTSQDSKAGPTYDKGSGKCWEAHRFRWGPLTSETEQTNSPLKWLGRVEYHRIRKTWELSWEGFTF